MRTSSRVLAASVLITSAVLTLGWAGRAVLSGQQQPTFRSAVDVIAIDVQVIDRDGQPVEGLRPDQFNVTINGQRRRVISASLVGTTRASRASSVTGLPGLPGTTSGSRANSSGGSPLNSLARTVVLAFDNMTMDVTAARDAAHAARAFIDRSPPEDQIGLFAFPGGPQVNPTTDRVALRRALDTVSGMREGWSDDEFHLRPSEIVDLAAWSDDPIHPEAAPGMAAELANGVCAGQVPLAYCLNRLAHAVKGRVLALEGQAYASLSMLRQLFVNLSELPGRKTVVLVSGGVLASDSPGGRPSLDELSTQIGKAAAAANVAVYSLFYDDTLTTPFRAQTGRPVRNLGNFARDSAVAGRWLDRFAGTAGGAFLRVVGGNGQLQFERILDEMSAYYLLAVEPTMADRDGRVHEMRVRVDGRGMAVRSRSWVVVPRPTAPAARAGGTGVGGSGVAPAAPAAPAAIPRGTPESVKPLSEPYGRKDFAAFDDALSKTADLANVIRDFRMGDPPWPDEPRRSAAFGLELAVAGLFNANGFARDEGLKLLAQTHAAARQTNAGRPDEFECMWYWAEAAALEGLQQPELGLLFVQRARQRCTTHPRLVLAQAVLAEQQWRRDEDPRLQADVIARYNEAIEYADAAPEARVRAAWFLSRTGAADRALDMLGQGPSQSPEQQVRYLHDLIRGRVLQARGQADAAAGAYRQALTAWPAAQAARVGLMTSLLTLGRAQEAAELAEEIQRADTATLDPWWMYWRGDFRGYAAISTALRDLAK
jgi:VWFA-related protein